MKIGILGGTFDPIHLGHLITAETARDAFGLNHVILVPTGCSYFKEDQKVTPARERYEMTLLAASGNVRLTVTDMETRREGNSYTVDTLRELKALYPNDELFYIVGADTLVMMSLWREPQAIFDLCTVLVASRKDQVDAMGLTEEMQKLRDAYHARIELLPVRNVEISSSDIRARVAKGQSVRYLVPTQVGNYIEAHGLYRMGEEL